MKPVKTGNLFVVFCFVAFAFSTNAFAQQDAAKATESVIQTTDKIEDLRAQIAEIETKKTNLQERIRQLDEAMLPENLERTTVIAGSTRPEELRENRRRALQTEKKAAESQIELLDQSRSRIEMSIATTQPKPASTEPAATNNKNAESARVSTENQNPIVSEAGSAETIQTKPARRSSAKAKRKRVFKGNE